MTDLFVSFSIGGVGRWVTVLSQQVMFNMIDGSRKTWLLRVNYSKWSQWSQALFLGSGGSLRYIMRYEKVMCVPIVASIRMAPP